MGRWVAGALAGGVAGVLFAVVIPPEELMPMVASLYGLEGVVWGWVFHLLHSLVFGLPFAVLLSLLGPRAAMTEDLLARALVGAVYGVVVWLVFAAFVMPAWIGGVTDMEPPVPDWNRLSLVAHIVYGTVLATFLPMVGQANRRRGAA
ncbi:MAG: histidine kinase [Acidimicrobiia bacterium]|nr:histidine kinase [Acidimicrobiia bacterium]